MTLYEMLLNEYGYGNPFSFEEIKFNNYSLPWIKKELNKLVSDNRIVRYERGIYYIPEKTIFGNSSLNPQKIIEKKYLSNGSGYYSGLSFANTSSTSGWTKTGEFVVSEGSYRHYNSTTDSVDLIFPSSS